MNSFILRLQDATHAQDIAGVTSFVGEDDSGSFGILANQARMMTEEEKLQLTKASLHRMEEEIFKRLWRMGRGIEG